MFPECGGGEKWFQSRYGLDVKFTELAVRLPAHCNTFPIRAAV